MKYKISTPTTVFEALRKIYPDSSRRTLQSWIKNGRFRLDGKPLKRGDEVLTPDCVIEAQDSFKAPKIPRLKILYEDRSLIVIDKPTGLLSVPLDEKKPQKDALGLLRTHFDTDQIFAVHRIDRETSGVLLFARGKESENRLDLLFETHAVLREYFAIVEGQIKQSSGTWQSNLLELPSYRVIASPEGKTAITHFQVLRRSAKYTYLKLRLETGRKHQIRVHCQMAGHPVVGDWRYGAVENPLKRLCLHACTLGFKHPFTHQDVRFPSPLPKIFQALGGNTF